MTKSRGEIVMYLSRYTILTEMNGSGKYAVLNTLSGNFDIAEKDEYEAILKLKNGGKLNSSEESLKAYLIQRGYAFEDKSGEDKLLREKYADFNKEVNDSQVQLLLIPTYSCNLDCVYCFQKDMAKGKSLIDRQTVDAFFEYAHEAFGNKTVKPFVTLFGGEPLIDSSDHRNVIEYIIEKCNEADYELAVVTNGYALAAYAGMLSKARIKEIQVTVDGTRESHNKRRLKKDGKGTFDEIIAGIESVIALGFPVNFRVVLDKDNIRDLVGLTELVDKKGWLDLGEERFKTQIGRNYELFDCYNKPDHLMSQLELWAEYAELAKMHPILKKFHRPQFKGIRHLIDTEEMYMASFDTCPACKTEWVFDLNGDIYGCTASCGRKDLKLGSFYPEVELLAGRIDAWKKRNVLNIEKCRECSSALTCGGGCGVIALNKNGSVLSQDCRPTEDMLKLGINYYTDEILKLGGQEEQKNQKNQENQLPVAGEQWTMDTLFTSGCMVCGRKLIYEELSGEKECYICGGKFTSQVCCEYGHYICDNCHRSNVTGFIESVCINTKSSNPYEIVNLILMNPDLPMHGPEHHMIVQGAVLAAYKNLTGMITDNDVREGLLRGSKLPGGTCGYNGACGAGISAGIAYSIINGVTPMSNEGWGESMEATAGAFRKIAESGGPRCCKNAVWSSLESIVETIEKEKGITFPTGGNRPRCTFYKANKDCKRSACRYFPGTSQ